MNGTVSMPREALSNYIANMQLQLSEAAYFHCTASWHHMDVLSDFNRLYYFLGEGGYLRIGQEELYPKRGQLVVLPAGTMLSVQTMEGREFAKYFCHFQAKSGDQELFQLLDTPSCVDAADPEATARTFGELIRHYRGGELTSMLRAKLLLQELLCQFIERGGQTKLRQPVGGHVDKVSRVLAYIDHHLADGVTLEQLAELAHFHPNYFIRFFKSATGRSPVQYMNQRRMEKAKSWMAATDISVSEAAERVGSSLYQFSKMFKQYTGASPSEYRKMMRMQQTRELQEERGLKG
ncbi:helix-turn-helix transcriptional regulator [Paenibacillus sacheonensis]|uniref:AraC family transcriptional regulator n=1 Tax=Paenibacillus sacheonensis TaxID=742054 RepID=A0A7X5C1E4_9BACL|nr:AraC family transcriptional regulator [Paenibacillus sacheonensis]MBM7569013.1 AraC-like DNA-binding protein [Paenibacillus sacheonensis]NBC72616.1 AraC family transcriptional regulator [Paenibacillus sacheonensis]